MAAEAVLARAQARCLLSVAVSWMAFSPTSPPAFLLHVRPSDSPRSSRRCNQSAAVSLLSLSVLPPAWFGPNRSNPKACCSPTRIPAMFSCDDWDDCSSSGLTKGGPRRRHRQLRFHRCNRRRPWKRSVAAGAPSGGSCPRCVRRACEKRGRGTGGARSLRPPLLRRDAPCPIRTAGT